MKLLRRTPPPRNSPEPTEGFLLGTKSTARHHQSPCTSQQDTQRRLPRRRHPPRSPVRSRSRSRQCPPPPMRYWPHNSCRHWSWHHSRTNPKDTPYTLHFQSCPCTSPPHILCRVLRRPPCTPRNRCTPRSQSQTHSILTGMLSSEHCLPSPHTCPRGTMSTRQSPCHSCTSPLRTQCSPPRSLRPP